MALFDLALYYTPDQELGEDMNGVSVEEVKNFLLISNIFPELHALTIRKRGNDNMMKVSIRNERTRSGSRTSFWQITTKIESNNMVYKTQVFNREDVYDRFKNAFIVGAGGRRRRATRKRVLRKRSTRRARRS